MVSGDAAFFGAEEADGDFGWSAVAPNAEVAGIAAARPARFAHFRNNLRFIVQVSYRIHGAADASSAEDRGTNLGDPLRRCSPGEASGAPRFDFSLSGTTTAQCERRQSEIARPAEYPRRQTPGLTCAGDVARRARTAWRSSRTSPARRE